MLICWSGGCDSTLLLLMECEKIHKSKAKEGKDGEGIIRTLSLSGKQLTNSEAQMRARDNLSTFIKAKYPGVQIDRVEASIDYTIFHGVDGSPQAHAWLVTSQVADAHEDVAYGFIRGDDFWHHRIDFETAFNAAQRIIGKTGKALFPFEWDSKADVLRALKTYTHNGMNAMDYVSWCDEPRMQSIRCNECTSCITHQLGERRLELEDRKYRIRALADGGTPIDSPLADVNVLSDVNENEAAVATAS